MSSNKPLSTSAQITISIMLLVGLVLAVSFIFISRVSEGIFINNYSEEIKRVFQNFNSRGMMGMGKNKSDIFAELYIQVDADQVNNPDNLSIIEPTTGSKITKIDSTSYLVYGFKEGNQNIILAQKMLEYDIFINSLRTTLFISLVISAVLTLLMGLWLSRRISRPLRETSDTFKNIAISDLSKRVKPQKNTLELMELTQSINKSLDKIEDGFKRQEQFSSDVSHEIRSPLTSIIGFAKMIMRWGSKDPEVSKEAASEIYETSKNMITMTEGLLFLSNPDPQIKMTNTDLGNLIGGVAGKILNPNKIEINIHVHSIEVSSDVRLLELAIKILLENAINHGMNSPVFVEWNTEKKELSINDGGIGIQPELREKIFDRFFQIDSSRSQRGHGLGLSILKKICDYLELKIRVEDSETGGASFILSNWTTK